MLKASGLSQLVAGTASDAPSSVRWRVVGFLGLISALTYLDRLNFGIAGKYIQDEFGFSTQTMGWALSAFSVGYALFQIPAGWMGDRFGPKRVMTVAIVWWSVFTLATAIAPILPWVTWIGLAWSFALVRFLVGMGEAAAFPNCSRMIANWINPDRRGMANSVFFLGVGLGGTVTPILISWTMSHWGWRRSFLLCGAVGAILAPAWHRYVTNRPEDHTGVNAAECELIQSTYRQDVASPQVLKPRSPSVPWRWLFRRASVWSLILSYFCLGYASYIYYTWFFIYLTRVRHLAVASAGLWGATPFLAALLLTPVGGWFSDFAVKRRGRRRGRQIAVWLGLILSAGTLALGARLTANTAAIVLLALAAGFNLFATPTWWATCNDLTKDFSGSLSGLMNMCGNIGGWLSPILTATLAVRFGWTIALEFAAGLTLVAAILWIFVNADEKMVRLQKDM